MQVRAAMSDVLLTIGPGHTLREAAASMCRRNVGAAVVFDPDAPGPGLITERDILIAVGSGRNPDDALVADHLSSNLTFSAPDWSLEGAAATMISASFRHLLVCVGSDVVGILSMRDIVRLWTGDGATCDVPDERSHQLARLGS